MKAKLFILLLSCLSLTCCKAQNIGIGTTAPVSPLDVKGNLCVGSHSAGFSGTHAAPANGAIIQGPVSIGNSAANANAMLDLTNAATKGLLLPSITSTAESAITSPTNGLIYYNSTTNCVDFYTSGHWEKLFCSN